MMFFFQPYLGKWSKFNWYFSDGLKPPTRKWFKSKFSWRLWESSTSSIWVPKAQYLLTCLVPHQLPPHQRKHPNPPNYQSWEKILTGEWDQRDHPTFEFLCDKRRDWPLDLLGDTKNGQKQEVCCLWFFWSWESSSTRFLWKTIVGKHGLLMLVYWAYPLKMNSSAEQLWLEDYFFEMVPFQGDFVTFFGKFLVTIIRGMSDEL